MTRINCIPPEELSQKHLLVEYRELPRIFTLVRAASLRGEVPDNNLNPKEYCLGKGHVRFFYPRLKWLYARQEALVREMQRRGYAPQFIPSADLLDGIGPEWQGDWVPDVRAIALNRQRIATRLAEAEDRQLKKIKKSLSHRTE